MPKPPTILVTGGRAPAALEFCRDLVEAGCKVIVGECRPWTIAAGSRKVNETRLPSPQIDLEGFQRRIAETCLTYSVQFIQPICEEAIALAHGAGTLPEDTTLKSPRFDTIVRLHHKGEFIRMCEEAGLPAPATTKARPGVAADRACIAKPVWSRSGGRTLRLSSGDQAPALEEWILQEELFGTEICTFTACRQGRIVAHAAYRPTLRRGYAPSWGFESVAPGPSLEWVRQFVSFHGIDGLVGFDLMDTAHGLLPMECNPRATSGIHFLRGTGWTSSYLGIDPAPDEPVLATAGRRYALLGAAAYLLPGMLVRSPSEFARILGFLTQAKDPILSWKDPLPFLRQIPSLLSFLRLSRDLGISPESAVSYDLEWNANPHSSKVP